MLGVSFRFDDGRNLEEDLFDLILGHSMFGDMEGAEAGVVVDPDDPDVPMPGLGS
jgi:hypothetical protein